MRDRKGKARMCPFFKAFAFALMMILLIGGSVYASITLIIIAFETLGFVAVLGFMAILMALCFAINEAKFFSCDESRRKS